jgi:crossover junction endodeoxyribonuclease RusA
MNSWRSKPFPDPAARLNANDSRGQSRIAAIRHTKQVRAWREAGRLCAFNGRRRPRIPNLATVTVFFGTDRPNQRRDPMNWYPTVKALVDGLTDARFWPDDDASYVLIAQPVFTADIKPAHFVIQIDWDEPEQETNP